jgi:hypothetical protein
LHINPSIDGAFCASGISAQKALTSLRAFVGGYSLLSALAPRKDFSLTYEGPALEDGRMEVHDLAPALLALGDMFQDANTVIDPDGPAIALQIRDFHEGSFEILLALADAEPLSAANRFRPRRNSSEEKVPDGAGYNSPPQWNAGGEVTNG